MSLDTTLVCLVTWSEVSGRWCSSWHLCISKGRGQISGEDQKHHLAVCLKLAQHCGQLHTSCFSICSMRKRCIQVVKYNPWFSVQRGKVTILGKLNQGLCIRKSGQLSDASLSWHLFDLNASSLAARLDHSHCQSQIHHTMSKSAMQSPCTPQWLQKCIFPSLGVLLNKTPGMGPTKIVGVENHSPLDKEALLLPSSGTRPRCMWTWNGLLLAASERWETFLRERFSHGAVRVCSVREHQSVGIACPTTGALWEVHGFYTGRPGLSRDCGAHLAFQVGQW